MRLHAARIPMIVREIVDVLMQRELVEVLPGSVPEVARDVESVLAEYVRMDRQLTDEAKDLAAQKSLDYSQHQKIKKQLAERKKFGIHEEAISYLANQVIETLLHTGNIEEIFAEDHELRAAVAPILRRSMVTTDPLDEEVRKRIKNLQEGTQDWEIEYQQTLDRLRRARGLS